MVQRPRNVASQLECWKLLFNIALSHGEAVRTERLDKVLFNAFLHNCRIYGSRNGVSSIFVEELWDMVVIRDESGLRECGTKRGDTLAALLPPDGAASCATFQCFVVMMNAVCVRCYRVLQADYKDEQRVSQVPSAGSLAQSPGNSSSRDTTASRAGNIFLAVPCVQSVSYAELQESVDYVSTVFLFPYITKNVVSKSAVVVLDPSHNTWTPFVNKLISHIVGSTLHSVVIPLFRKFSVNLRMSKDGFDSFVSTLFPALSAPLRAAADSVFSFSGFTYTSDVAAKVLPGASQLQPFPRVMELDHFVDALLMLAIVAFADENENPSTRCISAKVWRAFAEIYVPFEGQTMAPCPLHVPAGRNGFVSVPPTLGVAYPSHLEENGDFVFPPLLLTGLNLSVATVSHLESSAGSVPGVAPGRLAEEEETLEVADNLRTHAAKLMQEECGSSPYKCDAVAYGEAKCVVECCGLPCEAVQVGPNRVKVALPPGVQDADAFTPHMAFLAVTSHEEKTVDGHNIMTRTAAPLPNAITERDIYSLDFQVEVRYTRTVQLLLREEDGTDTIDEIPLNLALRPVVQHLPRAIVGQIFHIFVSFAVDGMHLTSSGYESCMRHLQVLGKEEDAQQLLASSFQKFGVLMDHNDREPSACQKSAGPGETASGRTRSSSASLPPRPKSAGRENRLSKRPSAAQQVFQEAMVLTFSAFLRCLGERIMLDKRATRAADTAVRLPTTREVRVPEFPVFAQLLQATLGCANPMPLESNARYSVLGHSNPPPFGAYDGIVDFALRRAVEYSADAKVSAAEFLEMMKEIQRRDMQKERDARQVPLPTSRLWNVPRARSKSFFFSELDNQKLGVEAQMTKFAEAPLVSVVQTSFTKSMNIPSRRNE